MARLHANSCRGLINGFAAVFLCLGLAACAAQTVKSQASREFSAVETDLTRGASTRADVLRLLGQPDGHGAAVFGRPDAASDIWYYEVSSISFSSGSQQILAVFFRGDAFDGYLWFANSMDVHF
jgi:hypothetical protein